MDRTSKKLLKYLSQESPSEKREFDFTDDLAEIACAIHSDVETVRAAVRYLEAIGYLKFLSTPKGHTTGFYLDHKGLHWKEFRRQEILHYIEDKWIDFFSLLAAVAALVISLIALLSKPGG